MFATPIGYLLNQQGIISTDVAVGGDAIMALVDWKRIRILLEQQLEARVEELRKELEKGETHLRGVEQERAYLRQTMLRISGAIQALEQILAEGPTSRNKHPASVDERDFPRDQEPSYETNITNEVAEGILQA